MNESGFEERLMQGAAPRLKAMGYEYDDRLREGEELFGFRKPLGDDVHAIVQFQRHYHATNAEFTINLIRAKTHEIQPRVYGGYASSRGARLSNMLWFVHNLRLYPQPDHWWTDLNDALDQLERYGLAWIEDPQAKKPWEMPTHRGQEFAEAVRQVIGPVLERSGYRSELRRLMGDIPYPYFVKDLPDGMYAFVEFQTAYGLDPEHFTFDVRLQRKPTIDPFDFAGGYRDWRNASLGQLAWRARHAESIDNVPFEEVKSVLWQYDDRAELIDQLRDALDKITQIGLPWLEGESVLQ
jgi:hypothetical protein